MKDTHRIGTYYTTKIGGEYVWVEGGCLADLNQEYIKGMANWQQGLSITKFEPEGSQYLARAVPMLKGKLVWGGQLISS